MKRATATIVTAGIAAFSWLIAAAMTLAVPAAAQTSPAAACLSRPTVTCSVDLALTASAGIGEDYERARLVVNAAKRMKDLGARKAYLDRTAARFFTHATTGQKRLDRERRVTGITAAIVAGDDATAGRLLGEVQDNFQRWWQTLSAVIDTLAEAGKPGLAVATEAKYHRAVNVNLQDALGRKLGNEVWDTRQPLAHALVQCGCGPDPLPMVLALPKQSDRVGLASILYARRHDVDGLAAFLTREFGKLGHVKDKTQRNWIGYAFGLMLRKLPVRDIPAALRKAPHWLTADNFERPNSVSADANIYGAVLARAAVAGDRAAVVAIVKLRPHGDTVWLPNYGVEPGAAAEKVMNVLPKPERERLRLLRIRFLLAHGDPRKGLAAAMKSPAARAWRERELDPEDSAEFEVTVLSPLLARGAFDVAEDAAKHLRDTGEREDAQATIANAKKAAGAAPKTAAATLTAQWDAYQKTKTDPKAGRTLLFAVRDLLKAQPNAFPVE